MMTGKEKLYFLLEIIEDVRVIAPSGEPLKLHPMNDLNSKYSQHEQEQLFTKLEKDENILKILKIPGVAQSIIDMYDPNYQVDDGCWHIQLLPAFDKYYLKIQKDPEYQKFTGKKQAQKSTKFSKKSLSIDLSTLHPEIYKKCRSLYRAEQYAEAAEKGFKVVRDKLRELTGNEKGSDAFGIGKLHIKGAAAQNVDEDFNQGVKFLTMAIDKFRNEKSHTSDAKIDDPQRAYEYLTLSSLAMNLLDQAEISPTAKEDKQ